MVAKSGLCSSCVPKAYPEQLLSMRSQDGGPWVQWMRGNKSVAKAYCSASAKMLQGVLQVSMRFVLYIPLARHFCGACMCLDSRKPKPSR